MVFRSETGAIVLGRNKSIPWYWPNQRDLCIGRPLREDTTPGSVDNGASPSVLSQTTSEETGDTSETGLTVISSTSKYE